jgi:CheY-like chemotaxis protein
MRRRFLAEGVEECRQLIEDLDHKLDIPHSLRTVRGWVEAARALDYPVLAGLARDAEKLLSAPDPGRQVLWDALSNLMVGFVEPPEATMGPIPGAVEAALKGKRVALVGISGDEEGQLFGALERAGAQPRVFEAGERPSAAAIASYQLVVVHVGPATLGTYWLHPLTVAELKQPLVLIVVRGQLLELDPSVLPRAAELLIDGWQPEEALIRLGHAAARATLVRVPAATAVENGKANLGTPMPREVNRETEVLLADDDLTVRMVTRSLMQNAGIKCRMACDGTEALQAIRDCRPTAAILDVNMPGMDGYEVLAAVRSEMLPTRIILLTARQQESDITRGFTLGADDYVVKPFNPPELLARVKRYL